MAEPLGTYRDMQLTSLALRPEAPDRPVAGFTPGEVLALLEEGRIDEGMRAAIELFEVAFPYADGGDADAVDERGLAENLAVQRLVDVLAENPLVAMSRARWLGYAADPDLVDVALGEGKVCGATARGRQMLQWTLEHSAFVRALRRRRSYLAGQIDLLGGSHSPGPVAALFSGYGRELLSSRHYLAGDIAAHFVGHDPRTQGFARALHRGRDVQFHDATLADVIGESCRLYDCALVYAPDLADHLAEDALLPLIESALTWLRRGGEFVLPALSDRIELGFLGGVAGWRPNVWAPSRLMRLAQDLGDVAAWLRQDNASGVSFLHLQRC